MARPCSGRSSSLSGAASATLRSLAYSAWPLARQRSRSASNAACCRALKAAMDAALSARKRLYSRRLKVVS
jgi:deoxycytidylate deaminase